MEIKSRKLDVVINDKDGQPVFGQKDVVVPEGWSDRAATITAEKYFRVINGKRETSAFDMVDRVVDTIVEAGLAQKVLTKRHAKAYRERLRNMLLLQKASFNSPVWFNIGVPGVSQQGSACFIQRVDDTMESIMELLTKEVMLFKGGSGTGSSLTPLRSSYEKLRGGGFASGPVSFMKMFDQGAGVTKSGGTTRRAAKMICMDISHPDILKQRNGAPGFITCKEEAEYEAQALHSTGKYSAEWNVPGNIYERVDFQNANHSVRVTDEFMRAVEAGGYWTTKHRDGSKHHLYNARDLFKAIAKAAWVCGDPGLQFDTTINNWHTTPKAGRINASNPCSEYMYLDDSACNLASFNLLKYVPDNNVFDVNEFVKDVQCLITAQEILVDYADYPSEQIKANSRKYRPLGIGYANLGATLMVLGLPYDSDEGRDFAAAVTSLLSAVAYAESTEIARKVGPAEGLDTGDMLRVMRGHEMANDAIDSLGSVVQSIKHLSVSFWKKVLQNGKKYGFRNGQISVIAPTGTIAFMMDCDTTGAEPCIGLTSFKKMVGGGYMKQAIGIVPRALRGLGLDPEDVDKVLAHLEKTGEVAGCPDLSNELWNVFHTALGEHQIAPMGHVKMLAAIQPFVSGSISKTVNLPSTATQEDIEKLYMDAWKLGLKCIAVYRDGCKITQPVSTKKEEKKVSVNIKVGETEDTSEYVRAEVNEAHAEAVKARELRDQYFVGNLKHGERRRLADHRDSVTHKLSVGGQEGYVTVGKYPDGSPAEIFINVSKAGSTLQGVLDMAATMTSIALQYGAPLPTIIDKLKGSKYEPAGFTANEKIRSASSISDYIGQWLEQTFTPEAQLRGHTFDRLILDDMPLAPAENPFKKIDIAAERELLRADLKKMDAEKPAKREHHGNPCSKCGNMTQRAGSCFVCTTCGTTTGCG